MFARSLKPLRPLIFASAAVAVGYAGVTAENRRVWNSVGNWEKEKGQYNEDLKTNRHKSECKASL